MADGGLRAVFLAPLDAETRAKLDAEPVDDLEAHLAERVASARAAWPGVVVPVADFLEHVASKLPGEPDPPGALRGLHTDDLYLAFACSRGDPAALSRLEQTYFEPLDAVIPRGTGVQSADVKQALRETLLCAVGSQRPRIAKFTGRGDLHHWLRVSAVHTALKLMRKYVREAPLEDDAMVGSRAGEDPELGLLKHAYREQFKLAFEQAMQSLTARQRNLLRQYYVRRATMEQIAGMYGVHRNTVTQWLDKSRERLARAVRQALSERLNVDPHELASIMRLIRSQIDVSIRATLITERGSQAESG